MPNFTYGWFLLTPIRSRLLDLGIEIADVRIGSTEAHSDEFLVSAEGKPGMFSDETLEFIVRENPIIIMVDGSNSWMRDSVANRYPDAHKAFVNMAMLVNYCLAGNTFVPDPNTFRDSEEYMETLLSQPRAKHLVEKIRKYKQKNDIPDRTTNAYGVKYYNPHDYDRVALTMDGRWASRHVRAMPTPINSLTGGVDTLDYTDTSDLIVTSVNVRDESLPAYVKEKMGNAEHRSASLDDHIKKRMIVDSKGVRPSHVFEDEFKRQYVEAESIMREHEGPVSSSVPVAKIGELQSLPFSQDKKFLGVLLDIDGTMKQKGQKMPAAILDKIADMLSKGYKVGIITGRSKSIERVFLKRIRRRADNTALRNLYVFTQNGAQGYHVGADSIVLTHDMDIMDKQTIVGGLKGESFERFGFTIGERTAIITIKDYKNQQTDQILLEAKKMLIDLGLDEKYRVVDTGVNINILPNDVNKRLAAVQFGEITGLKQKDILKIGNSYQTSGNDYLMLTMENGVGVDDVDTTQWLLGQFFSGERVVSEPIITDKNKGKEAYYNLVADEIKTMYGNSTLIAVIGATNPTLKYSFETGEHLGAKLGSYAEQQDAVLFTGGVAGVGVDVFNGFSRVNKTPGARFFVVLPEGQRPSGGYGAAVPVVTFGLDMVERRIGMGKIPDVLIVLNGQGGTLDEARVGLENGKKLIVLDHGGAGSILYRAKENGKLNQDLLDAGITKLEYLDQVILGNIDNIASALNQALSRKNGVQDDVAQKDGGHDLQTIINSVSSKTLARFQEIIKTVDAGDVHNIQHSLTITVNTVDPEDWDLVTGKREVVLGFDFRNQSVSIRSVEPMGSNAVTYFIKPTKRLLYSTLDSLFTTAATTNQDDVQESVANIVARKLQLGGSDKLIRNFTLEIGFLVIYNRATQSYRIALDDVENGLRLDMLPNGQVVNITTFIQPHPNKPLLQDEEIVAEGHFHPDGDEVLSAQDLVTYVNRAKSQKRVIPEIIATILTADKVSRIIGDAQDKESRMQRSNIQTPDEIGFVPGAKYLALAYYDCDYSRMGDLVNEFNARYVQAQQDGTGLYAPEMKDILTKVMTSRQYYFKKLKDGGITVTRSNTKDTGRLAHLIVSEDIQGEFAKAHAFPYGGSTIVAIVWTGALPMVKYDEGHYGFELEDLLLRLFHIGYRFAPGPDRFDRGLDPAFVRGFLPAQSEGSLARPLRFTLRNLIRKNSKQYLLVHDMTTGLNFTLVEKNGKVALEKFTENRAVMVLNEFVQKKITKGRNGNDTWNDTKYLDVIEALGKLRPDTTSTLADFGVQDGGVQDPQRLNEIERQLQTKQAELDRLNRSSQILNPEREESRFRVIKSLEKQIEDLKTEKQLILSKPKDVLQGQKDGGTGAGGIDFRALPIQTKPIDPVGAAGAVNIPVAVDPQVAVALDTEWEQIEKQMRKGPMPYKEMKDYAASCKEKGATAQMDAMFACLANILRLEEDAAVSTPAELKEILTTLG
ncbi:MAG: HAD hydrolase family protein [Candidatus Omnitrophica bacterium]|nr:HAD hydrolase family protein [Candidatus Omnitrophota bacterium]